MTTVPPFRTMTYGGASLNIYHAGVGEGLPRHEHLFSHATMCHAGSIRVSNERRSIVMTKETQPVNLVANEWHEIEALEDGTVFVNVFSVDKY